MLTIAMMALLGWHDAGPSTVTVPEPFSIQWHVDKPGKDLTIQFDGIEPARVKAWRKGKTFACTEYSPGRWQIDNPDCDWINVKATFRKPVKWRVKTGWNNWIITTTGESDAK